MTSISVVSEAGSLSAPELTPPLIRRLLPVLLLLFVGSGCAALIYEVVWFQMLEFIIGGTAISIGVLLGAFMGGMCIGSLLFPRLIGPRFHPLRVYALIEASIGLISLGLLYAMPYVQPVVRPLRLARCQRGVVAGVLAAACLLPPTILMGATLPAIARWVESTPKGVAWLGFFYGGNTGGAVLGSLLSGFVLLRLCDMSTTVFVAIGINAGVALAALLLSLAAPRHDAGRPQPRPATDHALSGALSIYLVVGLSGASALGAEVVWTRLLSLLLGGTVYTFSLILAVFLFGLGIGSSGGAALARGSDVPIPRNGREWRWPAARSCAAFRSRGPLMRSPPRCPPGRSKPPVSMISATPTASTCCVACGRCCCRRFSGAPVFRWPSWQLLPVAIQPAPWAGCMPPTPSAPFSERWR